MADLNNDGIVTTEERVAHDVHLKVDTQKTIALGAFIFMVLLTIFFCTPLIAESRLLALGGLVSTMYIALAGIVGAYMGMTAWMSKK
jgi:hypothetical protein|tara:strand:+ start:34 stop:294 length:261 start_codon:yes stop_codon:yes gene_type:complete